MRNPDREAKSWTGYLIVALTLVAPALGGSTDLWAQATLCAATGLLFVTLPPKKSIALLPCALFLAMAALPLLAFLPAHWFASPEWRTALSQIGVALPATRSTQPWLTFQSSCLLWLGLAWACYLFNYDWTGRARERAWDVFGAGILVLAAALTIANALKLRVPFWPVVPEFGFFPNRNQTSNVLAIAGILIYANAFQSLQRDRSRGWIWLASLGLICWALILNYSRAGIVLFFVGIVVWHAWWIYSSDAGAHRKAIAWVPIAVLLGLLLLAGGETLLRFTHGSFALLSPENNARLPIHHDAYNLWMKQPWLGIGLGNFRSIFTSSRHYFISPGQAIHPESDWLWAGSELGAGALLLLAVGLGIWARACFPFSPGAWARMRFAALICGIAFVCHGFVDVSGHRLGSLWPALFLVSSAVNPCITRHKSRAVGVTFRLLGLAFLAIGACWFAALAGKNIFPTTAQVAQLKKEIPLATQRMDYERAIALASQGLRAAPMDWEFYHWRGLAEAGAYRARAEINRDFAAARYLLPNWPDLWVKEGEVWLDLDEPDTAFATWEEGMLRWPDNATALYGQLFPIVQEDTDLRDRWLKLGQSDQRCLPTLLQAVTGVEFAVELERIFSTDPALRSLTRQEQSAVFAAWYRVGNRIDLVRMIKDNPSWESVAWPELARVYGGLGDYQQAYDMALKHTPPMFLPAPVEPAAERSLASRFRLGQTNEREGLTLAVTQEADGRTDEALATLKTLSANPKASTFVYFAESQWRARRQEWQQAWESLARCIPNG